MNGNYYEPVETYYWQCVLCHRYLPSDELTPDRTGALWCDACLNWVQTYNHIEEEEIDVSY